MSVIAPAAVRAPASVRASLRARRSRVAATRPAHLAPRRVAPAALRGAADAFILARHSSRAVAPRATSRASASATASPPPGPRSRIAPLELGAAVAAALAQLCALPGAALAEVARSAEQTLITAAVLGFAHTIGEFGVVMMIGGNIPDKTRVISVQIYDRVEALEYAQAHALSGLMVGFAFVVLLLLYSFGGGRARVLST